MNLRTQFERDGFILRPHLFPPGQCDRLAEELTKILQAQRRLGTHPRAGLRNVLRLSPRAARIAISEPVLRLVGELIEGDAFPVRAILFDKSPAANWSIPWHQDTAIAVAARVETDGFSSWSRKEGGWQVKPPAEVLAGLVTMRLHLDDCAAENGVLRVLPGSHGQGELESAAIAALTAGGSSVDCELVKGGALLMRPLLLHASAPAKNPSHRRVLHVEYAATDLPHGLEWSERT